MSGQISMIPIRLIRLDFQSEECLDIERVAMYAEALQRGEKISPVVVRSDGETYWLQDGFHRIHAAQTLGHQEIEAEIIPGTYADMQAEWQQYLRALRNDLADH